LGEAFDETGGLPNVSKGVGGESGFVYLVVESEVRVFNNFWVEVAERIALQSKGGRGCFEDGIRWSDRIVRNGLVYNLRDLGGYRTRSGAYVRNGVLFRSSSVGNAPVELLVEELNVWTVVDLRTVEEALHTGYSEELSEVFPNKAANVRAFAEPDKRAMFFVPLISRLRAVQFLLSKGSCVDKTYACKSYFRIVP